MATTQSNAVIPITHQSHIANLFPNSFISVWTDFSSITMIVEWMHQKPKNKDTASHNTVIVLLWPNFLFVPFQVLYGQSLPFLDTVGDLIEEYGFRWRVDMKETTIQKVIMSLSFLALWSSCCSFGYIFEPYRKAIRYVDHYLFCSITRHVV